MDYVTNNTLERIARLLAVRALDQQTTIPTLGVARELARSAGPLDDRQRETVKRVLCSEHGPAADVAGFLAFHWPTVAVRAAVLLTE